MQNFTPGTIKEKGLCKGHCEGMSKVKTGDRMPRRIRCSCHWKPERSMDCGGAEKRLKCRGAERRLDYGGGERRLDCSPPRRKREMRLDYHTALHHWRGEETMP
ncbi:hypothetical protein HID58_021819 [Brassica napus]|uniref:Uncharacterized protein n=2 Tax=Brassica TaxID=3705 RepID=A0ABQ8CZW2_BRANA|nr:hypothetical protein HID58_021819 [Brassica napus]CAG7877158.1 unnamed protein product [Brassica rapa]CAG7902257.1 unnamed protein product [Brassica rapa]